MSSMQSLAAAVDEDKMDGDLKGVLSKLKLGEDRVRGNWASTALLSFTAIGVIYGDIGTSPLYVMNAIYSSSGPTPLEGDIIGALSSIIWAITLVPLLKYCFVALEFGNSSGEGGPFAVYTSLYPPREERDEFNRTMTSYPSSEVLFVKPTSFWERSHVKGALFIWVLFGTCLTISDGLLTPAVSVTSAVQGLGVAVPTVDNFIVAISIAILVVLFLGQGAGTNRVGRAFAPIVVIWLLLIGAQGIVNLRVYPSVFRAFSPHYAVLWFVNGDANFSALSGVLLAITGVEAMFANLGAFSKASIRISFLFIVYPCLMLAYLGQGAALITNGDAVIPNVFFNSIPGGTGSPLWWITFVFAILAAVIASQAMISGTFSLVQQLVRLHAVPSFKIVSTSNTVRGQIFVPSVNIMMLIGSIAVVAGFDSTGLTNAYGLAVAGTMIVTTTIITVAMIRIKRKPIIAVAFFIGAGFIDSLFFGSTLSKVPTGAWFPLSLAVLLSLILSFYSWARGLEDSFDATHRSRLSDLFVRVDNTGLGVNDASETAELNGEKEEESFGLPQLSFKDTEVPTRDSRRGISSPSPAYDGALKLVGSTIEVVPRVPLFAIFHNVAGNLMDGAPHSFAKFLKSYPSLPTVIVFLTIIVTDNAHVGEQDRYIVSRTASFDGVYIVKYRIGYRDVIDLSGIAFPIRERIASIEGSVSGTGAAARIDIVDEAMSSAVTHFLPHIHPVASPSVSGNKYFHAIRVFLIESIYRRVRANFDDYDQYILNDVEVLRMSIVASI